MSQRSSVASYHAGYDLEFDEAAHSERHHRSAYLHRHAVQQTSLHSSQNFDNTLPSAYDTSVAHPPPDASDISPNSSQDALSPQSRHSSALSHQSSPSGSSSPSSQGSSNMMRTKVPALDFSGEGPAPLSPEDFPLVSRDPSRGPSKGSLRSVDATNMHSPPKYYEMQRLQQHRDGGSSSVGSSSQKRPLSLIAAEREELLKRKQFPALRAPNGAHAISRSVSNATTAALGATYSFINDAERRRYEAEERKRKRLAAAQKQWEAHIANKQTFQRPALEQRSNSAFQHRLFKLKVRELQHQEELDRTSGLPKRNTDGNSTITQQQDNRKLQYTDPSLTNPPQGPTFWDLQTILYSDYIHQTVPQQLHWIGKSGDRDRSVVPPMMATSTQRQPIVLNTNSSSTSSRDTARVPHPKQQRTSSGASAAAYQALQEEKWFVAAQQRFHKIGQMV